MKGLVIFLIGIAVGSASALVLTSDDHEDNRVRCSALVSAMKKYTYTLEEKRGYTLGMAVVLSGLPKEDGSQIIEKIHSDKVQQAAEEKYEPELKLQRKMILKFCGCLKGEKQIPDADRGSS